MWNNNSNTNNWTKWINNFFLRWDRLPIIADWKVAHTEKECKDSSTRGKAGGWGWSARRAYTYRNRKKRQKVRKELESSAEAHSRNFDRACAFTLASQFKRSGKGKTWAFLRRFKRRRNIIFFSRKTWICYACMNARNRRALKPGFSLLHWSIHSFTWMCMWCGFAKKYSFQSKNHNSTCIMHRKREKMIDN